MSMRQRWQTGCVGVITACAISLLVAGLVIGIGVQRGLIAAPAIDRRFGKVRIVSYLTWNARCPPFVGCEPTTRQSYVVWIVTDAPGPDGVARNSRQLFALPIDPMR